MLRRFLQDRRRRWGLAAAGAAAAAALVYALRPLLPPFVLAVFLAYAVYPAVEALHRRGLSRTWAILLVYALGGLALGAAVAFFLPPFLNELAGLGDEVPRHLERVSRAVAGLAGRYERLRLPPAVRQAVDAGIRQAERDVLGALEAAVGSVLGLFGQAFNLVLAPVIAFYILLDLPRFRARVELLLPAGARAQALTLLREMDRVLAGFIRGQAIVSAAVGVLTGAGLALVGVPFSLVLGLVAGITNLIPYFGPFLGAVPGLLLAAAVSGMTLLKAALVYLAVQQLEAAVLVPRVMGQTVGLHPLALIFALLAGGTAFGLAGLVVAVPAAGLVRVLGSFVLRLLAEEPLPELLAAGGAPGGRPQAGGDGSPARGPAPDGRAEAARGTEAPAEKK